MNTFNILYKKAGIGEEAWDTGKNLVKWLVDKGPAVYLAAAAGLTGAGLAAGYGAARLANPKAVSDNTDKIITSEALQTEIDVTERKLAELLERRRQVKSRRQAEQKYDRFV